MKTEEFKQLETTLEVLDKIQQVNVSPFFKQQVMQRLVVEKEEVPLLFPWFSSRYQWATLVLLLMLNISAVFYKLSTTSATEQEESPLETFAQTYQLTDDATITLN